MKHSILFTIFASFAIIFAATFYEVNKRHEKRALEVVEKRITEAALNCLWDDVCKDTPITLKFLIDKKYLEEEVNPITKMYYSHDSYVDQKENTLVFYER